MRKGTRKYEEIRSVASFGVMGLVFHYLHLLEPCAERMYEKINTGTVHTACLILAVLFGTDSVLSAMFRTPITY